MAKFNDRVLALYTRGVKDGNAYTDLARIAVKKAYQPDSKQEEIQFMLDNTIKVWMGPLVRYFNRAGISVEWKAGRPPICMGLKAGVSFQAKAFEWIAANPVSDPDDVIKAEKIVKPLEGLAVDRAKKSIEAFIARLKKADPDASAVANEMLSAPKEIEVEVTATLVLAGPNGEVWDLDVDDFAVLRDTLIKRLAVVDQATPNFDHLAGDAGKGVAIAAH